MHSRSHLRMHLDRLLDGLFEARAIERGDLGHAGRLSLKCEPGARAGKELSGPCSPCLSGSDALQQQLHQGCAADALFRALGGGALGGRVRQILPAL